jgi:DNA-binding FadR family transcriptional regulator
LRIPKAAELVASEMRGRILRGELNEGDSLPSESELMLHFGVSRPTLREAFRILESEQLVSVRRGARGGARVHQPNIAMMGTYAGRLLQVKGTTLADVYEARLVIEPPMAGLFAARRPDAEIKVARDILANEEAAIGKDPIAVARHFAEFHQVIAVGAGNITLGMVVGMLSNIIEKHLAVEITGKPSRPEQEADNRRAFKAHKKLLELVEAGESARSESFWRRHMEIAGELLLQQYGSVTIVDLMS